MALPGYAAEDSLYHTSRSYRTVAGGVAGDGRRSVIAQELLRAGERTVHHVRADQSGMPLNPDLACGCHPARGRGASVLKGRRPHRASESAGPGGCGRRSGRRAD
jgi:hypothetical protein